MTWVCPSCGSLQNDECLKCSCGYVTTGITHTRIQIKNEDMKYAGFWKRLASILIDAAILSPLIFIRIWLDSLSRIIYLLGGILYCVVTCTYDVWFVAKYGQTPGKMAVGIKVVKVNGCPVSWKEAFLRHSMNILFAIIYLIAMCIAITKISSSEYVMLTWKVRAHKIYELYPSWFSWVNTLSNIWIWSEVIVLLFNKKRRALHDFIAGTVVIHMKKSVTATANNGVDTDAAKPAAQVTP